MATFGYGRASRSANGSAALQFGLVAFLILGGVDLFARTAPSKEYQVKAVFLFNFANFVDWPASSFPEATTPFVIGVLGDDPFGAYLDEVVRGEKIGKRPVEVRRYRQLREITICHVLFISRAEADRMDEISRSLQARSILTVGELDDFVREGGIIALLPRNGKLRLKVNLGSARLSGLTISSKLLRSAEIINSGKR